MNPSAALGGLGLTSAWHIAADDQPAVRIAADELHAFCSRTGCILNVHIFPEKGSGPRIRLKAGDNDLDSFHIRRDADGITVDGANGRSVLYAVYRLIDWIRGDRNSDTLDIEEHAHFRERWMTAALHGRTDDERHFRYLARIGVNTAYLRGRRDALAEVKHFTHYVTDRTALPAVSAAAPPRPDVVAMARGAYRLAGEHGMETVMFQDEPVAVAAPDARSKEKDDALPAALIKSLPGTMLGTAHCLRYRKDGWKALSVFHPLVADHYRELVREVLGLFPGLRTIYVYNEDAGAANIHPPAEPYQPEAYPAGYDGYPFAAHLHLANLVHAAGRAIKPALRAATVTYHWYQPDDLRRRMVAGLAPGSVLVTLAAWDDSIDSSILPDWTRDLIRQARERNDLVLIADDDFNGTSDDLLMEITAGFPIPFRTYRKLRMWAEAGVDGITQHHTGGPTLGVNSITDLAFREFSWRPLVSGEEAAVRILALLQQQLGNEAGLAMLPACRAVDQALDAVEAGSADRPYGSRLHHSYAAFMFPPHLEQGLRRTGPPTADYCGDGINPSAWLAVLRTETEAYTEALEHARAAAALASDTDQPFHLLFPGQMLSCRTYGTIMANAVAIVLCFKRTFLNFMEAEAAPDSALPAIWDREKANLHMLRDELHARRSWMQSPYGMQLLEGILGRVEAKIRQLGRHGI